jgi:hypothetical protein
VKFPWISPARPSQMHRASEHIAFVLEAGAMAKQYRAYFSS